MKHMIRKFAEEEFGNAVIDWTVLMTGVVLMAVAVVMTVTANVDTITDGTSERMDGIEVNPNT